MKEGIKELYKYKYSFKSHNEQGAHILRALQERKLLIDCPITQLPFNLFWICIVFVHFQYVYLFDRNNVFAANRVSYKLSSF